MNLTELLKAALWRCHGHPDYPSEWNGTVYGGGKVSQRFWEYHKAIELLNLSSDSVLLDIGGGSPATGAGFFSRVVAPHIKNIHILDANVSGTSASSSNLIFHRHLANYETLSLLFRQNPDITHVACISVFEHIPAQIRCEITKAINDFFLGDILVATLEYHSERNFFEHQLTTRTLSELLVPLTDFYLESMTKSPIWGETAYRGGSWGRRLLGRLGGITRRWSTDVPIPLWYPLALRFRRMPTSSG